MLSEGYDFEAAWFQKQTSLKPGKQTVAVKFIRGKETVSEADLKLKLERSATDSFNRTVKLKEISKGIYQGEIEIPFAGSLEGRPLCKLEGRPFGKNKTDRD